MNNAAASKAFTLASLMAMVFFAFSAHTAPQAATPVHVTGADDVQTVVISAKRLTPTEKARIDQIENLLSTHNAPLPKKHFRVLT